MWKSAHQSVTIYASRSPGLATGSVVYYFLNWNGNLAMAPDKGAEPTHRLTPRGIGPRQRTCQETLTIASVT